MKKSSKIVVIVIMIIVFFVLFAVVVGVSQSNGNKTPGVFGLILFGGLIAAIAAVWKHNPNKSDNEDKHLLKKD